jgi:hypothetical protein
MGDEEKVVYRWGADFPDLLSQLCELTQGRGLPANYSPLEIVRDLEEAYVHKPGSRRGGRVTQPGPPLPAGPAEGEEETERRKATQKLQELRVKIIPRPKAEVVDVFLRRLDAHKEAPESVIVPLVPPEEHMQAVKRFVAIKKLGAEQRRCVIMPRNAKEDDGNFVARLACSEKSACPLVLPRGVHESKEQFKQRLDMQLRTAVTIMPRGEKEDETLFTTRTQVSAKCKESVHPFDKTREDECMYERRLIAQKNDLELCLTPGDAAAINRLAGDAPLVVTKGRQKTPIERVADPAVDGFQQVTLKESAPKKEEKKKKGGLSASYLDDDDDEAAEDEDQEAAAAAETKPRVPSVVAEGDEEEEQLPAAPPKPAEPEPAPAPEPEPEPEPERSVAPEPERPPEPASPQKNPKGALSHLGAAEKVKIGCTHLRDDSPKAADMSDATISMGSMGFMPLKRLMVERGVPKEEVNKAPSKPALRIIVDAHPECNIKLVD